jgi:sugar phosphate isomerase/epimerase
MMTKHATIPGSQSSLAQTRTVQFHGSPATSKEFKMSEQSRRVIRRVSPLLVGVLVLARAAGADDPPPQELTNPFFAMNFSLHIPTFSPRDQASLLKELGYYGSQYLGTCDKLDATLHAMDRAGLEVVTAAVHPYNVLVDPGSKYPTVLKEAIRKLQGRETLLLFQFASSQYEHSSPQGDDRAVELGRELADYAREYGVRLAIYPHVNIWCERVDHAARIAERCNRDNLGVCFNLFHWLRTDPHADLDMLVRMTMPNLFLVTINGAAADGSYATLNQGAQKAERFLKPFVAAGYRGPIGLQCVGIAGDPRDNLARSMKVWRQMSVRLSRFVPQK